MGKIQRWWKVLIVHLNGIRKTVCDVCGEQNVDWHKLGFEARSKNFEKRLIASSCPSLRPSVCPHGTTRLPLTDFYEI
jgi:hypothetical protein